MAGDVFYIHSPNVLEKYYETDILQEKTSFRFYMNLFSGYSTGIYV